MRRGSLSAAPAAGVEGHGAGGEGVDADLAGRQQDARGAVWESLGMGEVGGVQRRLADDAYLVDATEEDVGRRQGRQGRAGDLALGRGSSLRTRPQACVAVVADNIALTRPSHCPASSRLVLYLAAHST